MLLLPAILTVPAIVVSFLPVPIHQSHTVDPVFSILIPSRPGARGIKILGDLRKKGKGYEEMKWTQADTYKEGKKTW